MKYIIITIIFSLTFPNFSNAQNEEYAPIEDVNLLSKYDAVLKKEYPNTFATLEVEGVYPISETHAKIVYFLQEKYHEAIVNSDRKDFLLVATFEEVPWEEFPAIVKGAFKNSDHGKMKVIKSLKGKTPYSSWFYAIDFQNGKKEERTFYQETGVVMKNPY